MDNNKKEPIIILGFGRSGTTWLSDIVSKSLGGLVLFEPFHPEVCAFAKAYCYHNSSDKALLQQGEAHISKVINKEISNKWLIRNHLTTRLEDVSDQFASQVWDNCNVIGYKAIRQNFMIPWIYNNISKNIVFVKRDLLSVMSSLVKRTQFWKEFGFDFHERKFFTEVIYSKKYGFLDEAALRSLYSSLEEDYEKMAFLWVVTHQVVEQDLNTLGIGYYKYEDLYLNPYQTTRNILEYLGYKDISVHPSYIFTPSMLTLRTFHKESFNKTSDLDFFWEDTLTEEMVKGILNVETRLTNAMIL